jgi:CBS domain-containing protein
MTQLVFTVRREASAADVAKLMVEHYIGCVPVVDAHGKLCGIITQSALAPTSKA